MTSEWYTVKYEKDIEPVLKELDAKYGLSNLDFSNKPEKLMGNYQVLTLINIKNMRQCIRIDAPAFIIDTIRSRIADR
ncbi:MAG: hypothetical protein AB1798_19440 [Spirochaetota bacterium]